MPEINFDDDDLTDDLLSNQRNITISNFIIHQACQLYYEAYKKKYIPLSFIEFVFREYKRYNVFSNKVILDFFNDYNPTMLTPLIDIYEPNYYSLIVGRREGREETEFKIDPNDYINISLSDNNMFGDYDPEVYTNLENITNHIEESDELLNIKELYESFMIRKVVLSRSTKKPKAGASNGPKVTRAIPAGGAAAAGSAAGGATVSPAISDKTLIGSESDVPNQRGHVYKMYFPKLMLPSPYPILQDKSRINSEHRARRLMSTDRQVMLVNKYKFNQVKYKTGFIEKRRAAQKSQKRKFNFDF